MTASASEMQVNLNESKQASLRTLLIAALVTPTIVVFFRVWSRALLPVSPTSNIKSRFWWDDYTVLAAAIINIVISVIGLKLVDLGLGLHIEAIPPGNIDYLLKLLWFTYVLFDWGSTLAKASAIFFYIRILGAASSRFKTSLWLLHGLNLLWLVVILIVTLLLCSPIEKNWNTTVPGRCINPTTLWLGNGASGLVIDLIILFIPLPVLWGLQMKLSRKLQTTVVFLVGYM
ncbi:hypothetical protein F5Y16DRAFT_407312 [Xylariaceae sp. FL0255]|nr:hypothetical protein F5Y16DRAFT_407312 [Xylariaceae sp. FL0255]